MPEFTFGFEVFVTVCVEPGLLTGVATGFLSIVTGLTSTEGLTGLTSAEGFSPVAGFTV